MAKQVVGLFANTSDAHSAIQELQNAGFSGGDISVVARDRSTGETTQSDGGGTRADEDAAFGATSGALMGGLGGLLAGLGALAIPGIGPVIAGGTLASALGSAAVGAGVGAASGGIIGALVGAGIPDDDANIYAEGVRRGGTLVTVQASDNDMAQRAADIMDRYNVQDIDRMGQDFRSSGWQRFDESAGEYGDDNGSGIGTGVGTLSGAATGAAIGSAGGPVGTVIGGVAGALTGAGVGAAADKLGAEATDNDTTGSSSVNSGYTNTNANTDYNATRTPGTAGYVDNTTTGYTNSSNVNTSEGEVRIPVVEENINIQKQEVESGGVRVNTRVEETPVNEQVTLHHEKVEVERHAVDRPVNASDIDNLREGTFEVRERAEQAIVNKEARVVEEVVVNKTEHQHTETVQDTVRRTDVDVEQIPGQTTTTGYTESGTSRTVGDTTSYNSGSQDEGAIERGLSKGGNAVERGTGLDLDRDGDVGQRDPRNNI